MILRIDKQTIVAVESRDAWTTLFHTKTPSSKRLHTVELCTEQLLAGILSQIETHGWERLMEAMLIGPRDGKY